MVKLVVISLAVTSVVYEKWPAILLISILSLKIMSSVYIVVQSLSYV